MKAAKRVRGKKATKRLKKSKKMEATKPLSGDAYRLIPGINTQTSIKPILGDAYKII
ncbi:MAG TPA: hypothetical protein VLY23_06550 [Candidatus Acidoferrum sp.]|nr:hypothetical protein [Candidatus Acidoferrum sp.]